MIDGVAQTGGREIGKAPHSITSSARVTFPTCWTSFTSRVDCLRRTLEAAPDYADAMFNLALLLQRNNKHAEAVEYWRCYLANDAQWAARARRSLKFCEMQLQHCLWPRSSK